MRSMILFALLLALSPVRFALAEPPKPVPVAKPAAKPLPPLPAGVTDLSFAEFFKSPVGPYGLEPTPKLTGLNGKKVRIIGFMVRREKRVAGRFILAGSAASIEDDEAGFADLPTAHLWAFLPYAKDKIVDYTPRPLLLIGTLEVGNREEKDEQTVSLVRLILDAPTKSLDAAKPVASPIK